MDFENDLQNSLREGTSGCIGQAKATGVKISGTGTFALAIRKV